MIANLAKLKIENPCNCYGVIYSILNLKNNKRYIGQSKDVKKRFYQHLYTFKNKRRMNYPLYKALHKYGLENFEVEILCKCNTKEELNDKEIYYIEYYNTLIDEYGYNVKEGGYKNGEKLALAIKKAKSNGTTLDKKVINLTDNIIYRSVRECIRQEYPNMKRDCCAISKVCNPNTRYYRYKGKEYRFLNEDGTIVEKKFKETGETKGYTVFCIEDNLTFSSKRKVFEYYNIGKVSLNKALNENNGYIAKINKTFIVKR